MGRLPGFLLEPEITRLGEQEPTLTAIPVFMGYVQRAGGQGLGIPTYITRYAEYERRYCVSSNSDDTQPWRALGTDGDALFRGPFLRSSLYLYFLNGGGPCYVLPVGLQDENQPPTAADFEGVVKALDRVPEITLLVPTDAILLPAEEYAQVCRNLMQHCATGTNRFCILDIADLGGTATQKEALRWVRSLGRQYLQWGAAYYPWLQLRPRAATTNVGETQYALPSAVAAAAYGTTDQQRGIWKAPANIPVQGVLGLSASLTLREMGELHDPEEGSPVNLVRSIHGRGIYLWGARTLDSDLQWRYVNVRRLVSHVETSLRNRSMFAVFEPNSLRTWIIVKGVCESFLKELWEAGGLAGAQQAEAFTVHVGVGETMTQADVDEGRMVVQIQLAPKQPLEFITLKIYHQVQALGN
jgi:uncharacterized protein